MPLALKAFDRQQIAALIEAAEALVKVPQIDEDTLGTEQGRIKIALIQGERNLIRKMQAAYLADQKWRNPPEAKE
ncbi:MAG: hypothetical protein EBX52_13380 [Proteobacteria bacterium]|nr:hypothetical protein [Pseudomonadota bacterium]